MLERAVLPIEDATSVARGELEQQRLERMFTAHHAVVWRTLRRRGLDAEAAADATQQVFLIAAERLADIHRESERAFLLGTALRLVRSIQRTRGRWQLDADMDLRAGRAGALADERAAVDLFDRVMAELEASLCEVFVLVELNGFSAPEIAELLQIPVGTVASRLRRAREAFRAVARRIELGLQREKQQ
jgi:RNA polymerase sigma-70 factor (ECF subfamily)